MPSLPKSFTPCYPKLTPPPVTASSPARQKC
jgi:hypothetical protein